MPDDQNGSIRAIDLGVEARKSHALDLVDKSGNLFQPAFRKWLAINWHLWGRFEEEALAVWSTGRARYSARTLIEFIRHETFIREVGGGTQSPSSPQYKINNSFVPDCSRLFALLHPNKDDFFERRTLQHVAMRTPIRSLGAHAEAVSPEVV